MVGSRFSAKSIGFDRRRQLPSLSFDNGVTITGGSRGPLSLSYRGLPPEALSGPIPWHCLRTFLMRDTGSHLNVHLNGKCAQIPKFGLTYLFKVIFFLYSCYKVFWNVRKCSVLNTSLKLRICNRSFLLKSMTEKFIKDM